MSTSRLLRHAGYRDVVGWLLRRYRRFRVTGYSMVPLLYPGHEVLVDPVAYVRALPVPGDIVVAHHPLQPDLRIIKRVDCVAPDGRCYLRGDNPEASSDSRQFGWIATPHLQGKVLCLFP